MCVAHRHSYWVGISAWLWYHPWGCQRCKLSHFCELHYITKHQQANILIDSHCHARLSDFGLVAVINESEAASTINNSRIGGTTRWMAPELMHPGKFGFTKECRVQLPSIGSDIYALGMTILEVRTFLSPLSPTRTLWNYLNRSSQGAAHFTTSL